VQTTKREAHRANGFRVGDEKSDSGMKELVFFVGGTGGPSRLSSKTMVEQAGRVRCCVDWT